MSLKDLLRFLSKPAKSVYRTSQAAIQDHYSLANIPAF